MMIWSLSDTLLSWNLPAWWSLRKDESVLEAGHPFKDPRAFSLRLQRSSVLLWSETERLCSFAYLASYAVLPMGRDPKDCSLQLWKQGWYLDTDLSWSFLFPRGDPLVHFAETCRARSQDHHTRKRSQDHHTRKLSRIQCAMVISRPTNHIWEDPCEAGEEGCRCGRSNSDVVTPVRPPLA